MAYSQASAQKPVRHIIGLATALGFAVIAMIWAAVEMDIRQERAFAKRTASQTAQNYARLFDEHIRQAINETDNTIKFIRQDYLRAGGAFDLQAWVNNQYNFKELALQFTIIGADGRMETTTTAGATPRVDLSDREHFRVHVDSPQDTLFISKPVLGRASGRWSIQLTRRIAEPDGTFRGVIVASLDPYFLSRFYESIDLGKGGGIAVVGRDGIVRAMAGLTRQTFGSRYRGEAGLARVLVDSLFVEMGEGEEIGRATAYRAINDWPLIVAVRVDDSDARRLRIATAARMRLIAAGLTVGVLGVILLGIAYWRRFGAALSELTRSRAAAKAASHELDLTLNNMAQGILMVDGNGEVAVVNQNALDLLGLPDSFTRAGFPLADLLVHERAVGESIVGDVQGGGSPDPDRPSVREHKRGGMVLEICTRPLPGGGFVQTYTDITERKRFETALRDARDLAEKASKVRTAFLATMSHEIRTPLNGIIGMSSILETTELTAEQRGHLKTIHECGEALLDIVNDVLDYAKLDSGAIQLEPTAVDVRVLTSSVKEILGPRAQEKNLTFDLIVADDVPALIEADGTRIRQVLINLVANALKFTLKGGIVVSVGARTLADGRPGLRFSIIDSGIGIAEESHAQLFKEFSQVDASITRRFGGTGLGLAICKRIVDALGGEIGVESTLGKGSVFWFVVPAPEAAAAIPPAERAPRAKLPTQLSVLLVEDNAVNQQVATLLLTAMGHTVTVADHGAAALDIAARQGFDVILMDMHMPVMDGTRTARALRAGGGLNAQTAIIGLTANAFASDRQACLDAGMDDFLAKPVTRAKLEAALARCSSPPSPAASGEDAGVDVSVRSSLFDEIGPEVGRKLIETFVDEARRLLAAIRAAAGQGDLAALEGLLHQLKGAAANLGQVGIVRLTLVPPAQLTEPPALGEFEGKVDAYLAAEERALRKAA
jgi:signal transduction histidine kinase/DNA-binding response OmpR family regulator